MSTQQLLKEAMALPLPERVALAQTLWQSIDGTPDGRLVEEEREAIELAAQRDSELSAGKVTGRTHDEVMQVARKKLGCA